MDDERRYERREDSQKNAPGPLKTSTKLIKLVAFLPTWALNLGVGAHENKIAHLP